MSLQAGWRRSADSKAITRACVLTPTLVRMHLQLFMSLLAAFPQGGPKS